MYSTQTFPESINLEDIIKFIDLRDEYSFGISKKICFVFEKNTYDKIIDDIPEVIWQHTIEFISWVKIHISENKSKAIWLALSLIEWWYDEVHVFFGKHILSINKPH